MSWLPGDVVLTSYGVGVVVTCPDDNDTHFDVRLWRSPGKSIGSTATAHLQPDAIIMKLPAAPGMTTSLMIGDEEQPVYVHAFLSSSHAYLVSPVGSADDNNSSKPVQYTQVDISALKQAPSAKFYPLLVELMKRGDETANATTALLQDEKVTKIVNQGTKYMESKTEEASQKSKEGVDKLASTVSATVSEHLPKEQEVQEVYSMLKDEELTILLQKGKDRLEELMKTDVSTATKDTLKKAGIVISEKDEPSSFSEAIAKSRDVALSSLEELLKDANVDQADLDEIRTKLATNFTTMFDSMSQAAKSDRTLSTIFESVSGKTSAWQEASGRLFATKSGSLFMEGASRLQQRAQNIFSKGQVDWAGEVGTKLTKAFTEGDAATARLKSIEMGDAVRSRLVDAIEVRSGSQGGLDGIIAGALTTISSTANSNDSGDKMQNMLTKLQTNASGATEDARETLISVLSNRSQYQDIAMMRIEQVMCDLDKHLGDEMTPAEIAAIASGKDGTAALFEPIAKRASKEISKHLDHAETTVQDPAIQAALQHVRRIISGELTVAGLMDEVVTILNDDTIVAAGETLVKHGEIALDAIEGISGNKIAGDVMEIAEKAGITKESVMSQLESLNVNEILDTAGNAVTDERARRELVSSATDTALDFVLRILPSMPVPPFDGVKDGLLYNLSNLSMQGFKVKKEDIMVEIAGMRATKHKKKQAPTFATPATGEGATLESETNNSSSLNHADSGDSGGLLDVDLPDKDRVVKATELLIIDVQGISAILDNVEWGFEQTYMPYLKGGGQANVKFSDGSIRLQFELRKRLVTEEDTGATTWEPVLCLHDRSCAIEQVDLVLQGESRLTWIFNKLAAVFKNVLRDYVVKTIINILTSKSGYILEQLNENLAPYWGMILRTTGLSMDELVEADKDVIVASQPDEDEDLVELVWRENLPLGMNLLLNDDSGKLKIVDFPRGSQARAVCADKEIDPEVFNGATIVAVNGSRFDFQEDLFDALKNPSRPKSIMFELANPDDAARVKNFVEGTRGKKGKKKRDNKVAESEPRVFSTHDVVFKENTEIGIEFMPALDDFGLAVKGFFEGDGGIVLASERDGTIKHGDLLTHINGKCVLGENGQGRQRALELLEDEGSARPLTLTFSTGYMIQQVFEKQDGGIADLGGPTECKLKEANKRIVLHDFENSNGTAESGGVLIGDYLVFINGVPVGAGCALMGQHQPPELSEVYATLRNPSNYPAALTFARPKQQTGSRWTASSTQKFSIEDAETICITADTFEQIGCVLASKKNLDIVVSDLFAVPGPVQLAMRPYMNRNGTLNLAVESINGQFVPSYASTSIVMNAMKRSWSTDDTVEVVFCDDERKVWVHKLK